MIISLPLVVTFSKRFLIKWVIINTIYLDKRDKNGKRFIKPDGCTFYLSPVDPLEIDKLIDELDSKKSSGPFGVPVSLLKNTENSFLFGYPNL